MSVIEKEIASHIQNVVRRSGWIELPSEGNSMYPLIRQGNLCYFVSCDPSLLKCGDIVLFFSKSERLITHRLIRVRAYHDRLLFFFKGDTNLGIDEPVGEEQIVGKLISIQKSRMKMKTRFLPLWVWGKLMVSFPILSGLLRRHLNRKPAG